MVAVEAERATVGKEGYAEGAVVVCFVHATYAVLREETVETVGVVGKKEVDVKVVGGRPFFNGSEDSVYWNKFLSNLATFFLFLALHFQLEESLTKCVGSQLGNLFVFRSSSATPHGLDPPQARYDRENSLFCQQINVLVAKELSYLSFIKV